MLHFYSWYSKLKNRTPLLWKSFSFFRKFVVKSFQWLSHKSISISQTEDYFNTAQDGPFRGCSRMGGTKIPPLPKISHTYPTMMKLSTVMPYLRKTQKIYDSRDTPLELCWHQPFFIGNQQYISVYMKIQI